jgi:hypothetical protein
LPGDEIFLSLAGKSNVARHEDAVDFSESRDLLAQV